MKANVVSKSIRLIVTLALLGYVFWTSGLFGQEGRDQFMSTLGSAHLTFLIASFCFPSLLDLISSVKWHYLARSIQLHSRVPTLWAFYIMGRFFNLVLPSNIGGDIIRIHLHGKMTGKRSDCAAAVFMERFTGLIMLILIALVIGWCQSQVIDIPFLGWALLTTIIATLVAAWAIIDVRLFNFLRTLTVKFLPKLDVIFAKVNKFRGSVLLYRASPNGVALALLNSALFYAAAIVYIWVAVLAFDSQATLVSMIVAVPLIMVMMNLPISIGSIGLMEFSYTVILGTVGISPESALATALLMRLHTFVSAGIGGLLYAVRHDKAAEELLHNPQASQQNP